MKDKNINQLLKTVGKNSMLLVVALAHFVDIDCSSNKNNKKRPVSKNSRVQRHVPNVRRAAPAQESATVVEKDSYQKQVSEQPLDPTENIESSVDVQMTQLPDGSAVETKTTIEVNEEEGKVVTTVETWTLYDYAKVAAITAGTLAAAGGAGYLLYKNNGNFSAAGKDGYDQLGSAVNSGVEKFNSGVASAKSWWNGSKQSQSDQAAQASPFGSSLLSEVVNKVSKIEDMSLSQIGSASYDTMKNVVTTPIKDFVPGGNNSMHELIEPSLNRVQSVLQTPLKEFVPSSETRNTPIKNFMPIIGDFVPSKETITTVGTSVQNTANQAVANVQDISLEKLGNATLNDIGAYGAGAIVGGSVGQVVGATGGVVAGGLAGGVVGGSVGVMPGGSIPVSVTNGVYKGARIGRGGGRVAGAIAGATLVGTALSNYLSDTLKPINSDVIENSVIFQAATDQNVTA